jgi:hypothetical protein
MGEINKSQNSTALIIKQVQYFSVPKIKFINVKTKKIK